MTDRRFRVAGSTAVVTGASSGIGKAIAERFAADVAQFLASPASSYVVGETITAAGRPDTMKTPE